METLWNRHYSAPNLDQKSVFITGLARSDTTILLQSLHATGQFRSLTYRDMPLVMMPTLWSKIARPFYTHTSKQQRAHGDGISVDYDSPEALEEIFWRIYCGQNYIMDRALKPHSPNHEVIGRFRQFVANAQMSDAKTPRRYLYKNNNNLLRLSSLMQAFPDATIIIPFRDPIQQALSSHRQHLQFIERHKENTFSRKYMDWLGHHEFGSNHKPFELETANYAIYAPEQFEYWLAYWIHIHRYITTQIPDTCLLLNYDQLCQSPRETLEKLFKAINIECYNLGEIALHIKPQPYANLDMDNALVDEASEIYQTLEERAL